MAWDPSFLRLHLSHMGAGPCCILQPPPRAPTPSSFLARKALGLESVLESVLWIWGWNFLDVGFAGRSINSRQGKDKGEPDERGEGGEKNREHPFPLQRKVRWAGGFSHTEYEAARV